MKIKNSTQRKIGKIMFIIVIPIILIAVVLLGYSLVIGQFEGIIRNILISLILIEMLWLCFIIFIGLTKYQNEFLMDDYEKKRKWKTLSSEYRKFHTTGFDRFSLIFFSSLILFGLSEILLYKNWTGINCIIIAVGFSLLYIKSRNKLKI